MNNVLGGGSRQLPAAGHEAGRERKNSTRRAARLLLGVPQICWKSEHWGFRHVSHHQELLEMSTLRSLNGLDPCTAQPQGTKSQAIAGVHEAEYSHLYAGMQLPLCSLEQTPPLPRTRPPKYIKQPH